jgi:hypothetical protein
LGWYLFVFLIDETDSTSQMCAVKFYNAPHSMKVNCRPAAARAIDHLPSRMIEALAYAIYYLDVEENHFVQCHFENVVIAKAE